jgi:hypothetical protein
MREVVAVYGCCCMLCSLFLRLPLSPPLSVSAVSQTFLSLSYSYSEGAGPAVAIVSGDRDTPYQPVPESCHHRPADMPVRCARNTGFTPPIPASCAPSTHCC